MDIQQIFAASGPLPQSYKFQVERTTPFLLYIAGSCFSQNGKETIGASVLVDGEGVGNVTVYANEKASHKPLPAQIFVLKLPLGEHTLDLKPLRGSSTTSDGNDWWYGAQLFMGSVQPFVWKSVGPLPTSTTFYSPVLGPALVFLSGSVFTAQAAQTGVVVKIDGVALVQSPLYVNEASSHKAFPTVIIPVNLQPGEHTMGLAGSYGTEHTDPNDLYAVTVLY